MTNTTYASRAAAIEREIVAPIEAGDVTQARKVTPHFSGWRHGVFWTLSMMVSSVGRLAGFYRRHRRTPPGKGGVMGYNDQPSIFSMVSASSSTRSSEFTGTRRTVVAMILS